jgi:UDP-2,4-diacetamido-2,4,6-trideoxy-beta-L-altropyranose hydrolase
MINQKLFIRADGGVQIGSGHIMRMIALGQAWQDQGGEVIFISTEITQDLGVKIKKEHFQLVRIHGHPGTPKDLEETCTVISRFGGHKQTVAVDGYNFNADFQLGLKKTGCRLLFMDDYGQSEAYHADWVLNQNITARKEIYVKRGENTRPLLGTQFALLRREFHRHLREPKIIPKIASKVLLTLGGTDLGNVTGKVIEALKGLPLELKVIVGGSNPNLADLRNAAEIAASKTASIDLIINPTDIPNLMKWADLAVAAGGSTAWELLFMGVPSLFFILANNQHAIGMVLDKKELGICLTGFEKPSDYARLAKEVSKLSIDFRRREKLSINCRSAVDGWGSRRVVEILKEKT